MREGARKPAVKFSAPAQEDAAGEDAQPGKRAARLPNSPLKNAFVAFFNLARCRAKLRTARKIPTYVAILSSPPCDAAAG